MLLMNEQVTFLLKLRFPEFRNDKNWNTESLNVLFERITDKNKELNQNVLTMSGQMGLISQTEFFNKSVSSKDLSGYYLLKEGDFAYNKSYSNGYPFGAIKPLNRYRKGVVSPLYICFKLKNEYKNYLKFFEHYFEAGIQNFELEKICQEGARNHGLLNISLNEFFSIPLIFPDLPEQEKIAKTLTSIGDLISASEQKLKLLEQQKKGLLQNLFPQNDETIPKLRFPDFKEKADWKLKTLKDIVEEITEKVGEREFIPISISSRIGFVSQSEKFGKDISGKQYKNYIVLKQGEFAYNKGNSKTFPQGCIFELKEFEVVASPNAYICFKLKEGYSNGFFQGYFENNAHGRQLSKFITSGARSDGLLNLNRTDFFSIQFLVPEIAEQKKIAETLENFKKLIESETDKIRVLREHKLGLMQQLFPKIGNEGE